jgi:hypothetical protein
MAAVLGDEDRAAGGCGGGARPWLEEAAGGCGGGTMAVAGGCGRETIAAAGGCGGGGRPWLEAGGHGRRREEAVLVVAMRSQIGEREEMRAVLGRKMRCGVGVWGGGSRATATVVCGISSSGTSSEARFEVRSSSRLWGVFLYPLSRAQMRRAGLTNTVFPKNLGWEESF